MTMLLIQTMKWFGPTPEAKRIDTATADVLRSNELTTYATSLSLPDAMAALREYDDGFRAHFRIAAVEHRLIGVQAVDFMDEVDLENARIWTIEALLENHRALVAEETEAAA